MDFIQPFSAMSNVDPVAVSNAMSKKIEVYAKRAEYKDVVIIGQSLGALLVKRAFLNAEREGRHWADLVSRVVLVAGMNRGWDISGQKPSDMGWGTRFVIRLGSWFARVSGTGRLVLSAETGSPFVANLRIDWIRHMWDSDEKCGEAGVKCIQVVQLLGDIDDLVSAEDNKDLRIINKGRFAWIKVRGTGHGNIADFADTNEFGSVRLGDYRRSKFTLAATEMDFEKLVAANEVLPFQPDPDVTDVVFIVHGIRDLGEWAAAFEQELLKQFREGKQGESKHKLAIASARYGYFGMGPFLLRPVREKYVKWLMDEYTETLAQYPNAKRVHFVGHSNGTYLLAAALRSYRSLEIGRIVFGGSVVQQEYPWSEVLQRQNSMFANKATLQVTNYVAKDDWVVALFPSLFERWPISLLNNDIGSAGFKGFSPESPEEPKVLNVRGLSGGHGAFLSRIPEIVDFILDGVSDKGLNKAQRIDQSWGLKAASGLSAWGASWGIWIVWSALIFVVVMVGWHVVTSAAEPRWPIFLVYVAVLLMILRSV